MKSIFILLVSLLTALPIMSDTKDGSATVSVGSNGNFLQDSNIKPHNAPRRKTVKEISTNGFLYLLFISNEQDISVTIYKEDEEVITDYIGSVLSGTAIPYNLNLYGQGVYTVHVTSNEETLACVDVVYE